MLEEYPDWYLFIKEQHINFIDAVENLGKVTRH